MAEGEDDFGSGYGLIVDGAKMYDASAGKIVADGYIDLQPPADDPHEQLISGVNMPVVGWASVQGKSSEEVKEINKTCSMPLVEEVSEIDTQTYIVELQDDIGNDAVTVPT